MLSHTFSFFPTLAIAVTHFATHRSNFVLRLHATTVQQGRRFTMQELGAVLMSTVMTQKLRYTVPGEGQYSTCKRAVLSRATTLGFLNQFNYRLELGYSLFYNFFDSDFPLRPRLVNPIDCDSGLQNFFPPAHDSNFDHQTISTLTLESEDHL